MSQLIKSFIAVGMMLPQISFAFFCPTNFSQIDYKMSMADVTALCGAPDEDKKFAKKVENSPQEWTYFIPQVVAMGTAQEGQGTMKTTMTFNGQGKLINISVNGLGVGSTQICGNINILLGATKDAVKKACGEPVAITKMTNPNIPEAPEVTINEFYYRKAVPPVVLVFENGVLTSKRTETSNPLAP